MICSALSSKILVVGPDCDGRGGISTVVRTYKKLFSDFNYVCTVKGTVKFTKLSSLIGAIVSFMRYMAVGSIELVHIHTASYTDFYRNTIFVLLSLFFNKKVILHIHGAEFELFYSSHPRFVTYVCNKVSALATVSNYFVSFLKNNELNSRVYLLHNIIDKPSFVKDNSCKERFDVSFIGAITERKGIYDVIETLGKNKAYFDGYLHLHVAGNGEVDRLYTMIKKYDLLDMVTYWGWADADLKRRILSFSDVFIHPSSFESFGISIAEAMSYRLPIITTKTGGITDLVEDDYNGIFVEYKNEKQIRDALVLLMEHPEICIRMGDKSGDKSVRFYSEFIESKIVDMYEELLRE